MQEPLAPRPPRIDQDVLASIPRNPLRMLVSAQAWLAVLYCATSIVLGLIALLAGVVGILVLPWVTAVTTGIERRRLALLDLPVLVASSGQRHGWQSSWRGEGSGTFSVWAVTVLFGLVDLVPGAVLLLLVFAGFSGLVATDPWSGFSASSLLSLLWTLLWVVIGLYVAWALAAAQAHIILQVLRPYSDLTARLAEVTSSRSELVDVFEAERRRIERDLHDGAQQHLVVTTMHLGEAGYWLDQQQPDNARAAVLAAQAAVEDALAALRDTIRGIHPQVLTDRGLVEAIRELAARQPLPVSLRLSGTVVRLPAALESAVFYVTSEALTNIARHSGAGAAAVSLDFGQRLTLQVADNGRGGAVSVPGHGISGLAERTRTAGGTFELASPPGGGTVVTASFGYQKVP